MALNFRQPLTHLLDHELHASHHLHRNQETEYLNFALSREL